MQFIYSQKSYKALEQCILSSDKVNGFYIDDGESNGKSVYFLCVDTNKDEYVLGDFTTPERAFNAMKYIQEHMLTTEDIIYTPENTDLKII